MDKTDEYLILIGQLGIGECIQYVRRMSDGGADVDRKDLARKWRAANARFRELQGSDPDAPAYPSLSPLPSAARELAEEHITSSGARHFLEMTPYQWALVELDRLIVYQKHLNLSFSGEVLNGLSSDPAMEDLVRVAIAFGPHRPPISVRREGDLSFTFSCPSNDLRILSATILDPASSGLLLPGQHTITLGVSVGLGMNFLSALYIRERLILLNGSHRAYALRRHGITRVPCLVQTISSDDELDIFCAPDIQSKILRYIRMVRPPLFKDYFDERLCMSLSVPRSTSALQISFSSTSVRTPAAYR